MLTFTDEGLRTKLQETTPVSADHFAFLPFGDLEQSVRDDVKFLRESPYTLDVPVSGYVYSVSTGALTKVE